MYKMIALITIVKVPKVIAFIGKERSFKTGFKVRESKDNTAPLNKTAPSPPKILTPENTWDVKNREKLLKAILLRIFFMGFYASKTPF